MTKCWLILLLGSFPLSVVPMLEAYKQSRIPQEGNAIQDIGGKAKQSAEASAPISGKNDNPGGDSVDTDFVSKALFHNVADLELAVIAQQKAMNKSVKELATRIVKDHRRFSEELKQIARGREQSIASSRGGGQETTKRKLENLSGLTFDRTFINEIVRFHSEEMTVYRRETNSGNDQKLKQFAAKALPVLNEHLMSAVEILKRLGGEPQLENPAPAP